jgi:membrane protein
MISQSNVLTWIGVKNQFVKELIVYGRWIPIFALLFYSFAFIYKYAPNTQKRWRLLSPGALFATLCSIVFYWGFSSFVDSFNRYNILYGSLGTVIVIMILVFLNSLAILIGFELNVSINSLKSIADKRKEDDKSASLHKR